LARVIGVGVETADMLVQEVLSRSMRDRRAIARYAGLAGSPDESALAQWFRGRTESARGTRKTMIVALARKLLIALWRLAREGVVPDGVVLRPA
jgi:transposase